MKVWLSVISLFLWIGLLSCTDYLAGEGLASPFEPTGIYCERASEDSVQGGLLPSVSKAGSSKAHPAVNATQNSPAPQPVLTEAASAPEAMTSTSAGTSLAHPIEWHQIQPGVELGIGVPFPGGAYLQEDRIIIIRIAPKNKDFIIHMASEEGQTFSFKGWAEGYNLIAGINASMYLPDKLTSTGLLKGPEHTNNPRAGSRLGAFFVSGSKDRRLPSVDIIERGHPNLDAHLQKYTYTAQNFRLISGQGDVLWPEGGAAHSIAVVAKDTQERILFILCQVPLTPHEFSGYLLRSSLAAAPVMYVEGGGPAGLFLFEKSETAQARPGAVTFPSEGGVVHIWRGRQSFLNTLGSPLAPVPNIIGVKNRSSE